jgi:hypothetical protein
MDVASAVEFVHSKDIVIGNLHAVRHPVIQSESSG